MSKSTYLAGMLVAAVMQRASECGMKELGLAVSEIKDVLHRALNVMQMDVSFEVLCYPGEQPDVLVEFAGADSRWLADGGLLDSMEYVASQIRSPEHPELLCFRIRELADRACATHQV